MILFQLDTHVNMKNELFALQNFQSPGSDFVLLDGQKSGRVLVQFSEFYFLQFRFYRVGTHSTIKINAVNKISETTPKTVKWLYNSLKNW